MNETIKKVAQHETDTGSVEVQVATLTQEIACLSQHLKANPKDLSSKRGLLAKVNKRTSFLRYLKERKFDTYRSLIQELGLRK